MNILLELFLFIGIFFPAYHILNSLVNLKRVTKASTKRKATILIPCYNEKLIINTAIDGILRIDYKKYECIFINDGSNDNTLNELMVLLELKKVYKKKYHNLDSKKKKKIYRSNKYPNIYVIDKENGGKSDALNIGINYSKYDYIVTIDADSVLKPNALAIILSSFDNPNVVATSGIIQIMQSFKLSQTKDITTLNINNLLKLQTLEYIKACFSYKASLAKLKSLLVISGAFGCFTKEILLSVNGFKNVIGEDLDLTVRIQLEIQNTNKIIAYEPNAICYTEGPENLKDYIKQRIRWQQSFIEGMFNYYKNILKNTFTKALSFFIVFDSFIMGVASSLLVIIFSSILIINFISGNVLNILLYLIIFISINVIYDISSLFVAAYYGIRYKNKDILRIIYTIFLDILFYRFLTLYTVILGSITYFIDHKSWNKVERSGRSYISLKE